MSDSAPNPDSTRVTQLLARAGDGDNAALAEVYPLVYEELRRLAGRMFAGQQAGHTLQPTALVNEAFLRIAGGADIDWKCRAHFLAVSARAMRQILIDHARRRHARKRDAGGPVQTLIDARDAMADSDHDAIDLLALDDALERLQRMDERKHRIVELRFFGGLTNDQVAAVLDVSRSTVADDWTVARAWLHAAMRDE